MMLAYISGVMRTVALISGSFACEAEPEIKSRALIVLMMSCENERHMHRWIIQHIRMDLRVGCKAEPEIKSRALSAMKMSDGNG